MAVIEIQSFESALTRVKTLFAGTGKYRLQEAQDIEDYAKIAFFLTQTAAKVTPALEEVSKQIWVRYNLRELRYSPNRFSRAIIKYGVDAFGFASQENVVFVGPLEGPEFLPYVRGGVLWKDTFAPEHGEFAHSLQWFAAGHGLNLGARTAYLYKKAGEVFSNSDQLATRGDEGKLARGRQPLWAWLVDCFWPGSLESQIPDTDIGHVFSKRTCRVPNEINKLALGKKSWFIHLYLDHRKQWLQKIGEAGKLMRAEEAKKKQETDPSFKLAEPDSNLLGIEKYQGKAYPAKTGWTRDDAPLKSLAGKDVPRSGLIYKKSSSIDPNKTQVEKIFHGLEGTVTLRAIDTKGLIT